MVEFKIDPKKTALLVIDMTNEFIKEGAPLEVPQGRKMIPKLKKVIEVCRSRNIPVIYTVHVHRKDGVDMGLMKELWEPIRMGLVHVPGSEGVKIYEEISPKDGDIIIEKHRYSAFYGTDLDIILRNLNIDTLIITGVVTNFCCESTARDAMFRDYKVIFLSDCNAAFDMPDLGFGAVSYEEVQKVVCSTIAMGFGEVMSSEILLMRLSQEEEA